MADNKVTAAKIGVQNMLMYYYQALIEEGCGDPKQVIATELPKMIKLTDEQTNFVLSSYKEGLSVDDILNNMKILLAEMESKEKYIKNNVTLLKRCINKLHKTFSKNVISSDN